MSVVIFVIPVGIAAFAIPLILLANRPSVRLQVAIIGAIKVRVLRPGGPIVVRLATGFANRKYSRNPGQVIVAIMVNGNLNIACNERNTMLT